MDYAVKGDLVVIHKVLLPADGRATGIPEETKAVPYEAWIKGFLLNQQAAVGEFVEIRTFIGRTVSGRLTDASPKYEHGFGSIPVDLLEASLEARGSVVSPDGE